jgi:uncharacterized protein YgbK (DUF1537 family)
MKTIILDDDPTGTQFASNVRVLLEWDLASLISALQESDVVYLQTNSRSISEVAAVELSKKIKNQGEEVSRRLNEKVNFILRGDSTLRGHAFAETEVFMDETSRMIFVPGYPDIGRTTLNSTHFVKIDGVNVPADKTEFANDPVFPFNTSQLIDYVAAKSTRKGFAIPLEIVRAGSTALVKEFKNAPIGSVIIPDVETNADLRSIAEAVNGFRAANGSIAVRSAAPLAAMMTGVDSKQLISGPVMEMPFSVLLVAGSHTAGATSQLAQVTDIYGQAEIIETSLAMANPIECGNKVSAALVNKIKGKNFALVMSERDRRSEHNTLAHGEKVMAALVTAVKGTIPAVDVVISKGGITSAEVAKKGIGVNSGWVLGQILPGISLWRVEDSTGRPIYYVVVPGNVGGADTLLKVLEIVGLKQ